MQNPETENSIELDYEMAPTKTKNSKTKNKLNCSGLCLCIYINKIKKMKGKKLYLHSLDCSLNESSLRFAN